MYALPAPDWFTSDTHFGHHNIITYSRRPYEGVEEMNDALVRAWNERVAPQDVVYHLGDVAMGRLEDSLALIARLNGRKLLVPGNHDRCWAGHRKRGSWPQRYEEAGFELLDSQASISLAGREVTLCHFPYEGDSHAEDRYREHRPEDQGGWLVHGHVHERWRQRGRMVNVGVDVWGWEPVAASSVEELILAGPRDLDRDGRPL